MPPLFPKITKSTFYFCSYIIYGFGSYNAGSEFSVSTSGKNDFNVPVEFFNVRRNYTYIGMNTRYADNSGAGLCQLYCSTYVSNSAESAKSAEESAAQDAAEQAKAFDSQFREFDSLARQPAPQPRE